MRAMIVDDEPLACRKIARMLQKYPEIEVLAEVYSAKEAVREIDEQKPDLLFLDIQMPGMNGFQILESLQSQKMPIIIFVTAYDDYALEAFNFAATDYLLKPFSSTRFEKTLERARAQFLSTGTKQEVQSLLFDSLQKPARIERLMVRSGDRIQFLPIQKIQWVEAHGRYLYLHSGKDSYVLRQALSALEPRLDPKLFVRISRKHIVNLERISELQMLFHGQYALVLSNGESLNISRRYFPKVRERLGLHATPVVKRRSQ